MHKGFKLPFPFGFDSLCLCERYFYTVGQKCVDSSDGIMEFFRFVFIFFLISFYFTGIENDFHGIIKTNILIVDSLKKLVLQAFMDICVLTGMCVLLLCVRHSFQECCNTDGGHFEHLRHLTWPDQYCIPIPFRNSQDPKLSRDFFLSGLL